MALERDFEKFTGGPVIATRDRMHVTISALGVIYMNQNTHRLLGKPAAVALYYSREKDTIAIEPASPRFEQNFPVKPMQICGWRILAGPFLGHFGIRTDHTLKFVHPDIDNGVLLLDLRSTVNVTPRRYKQKK
ncbi:MAG: hypothetical protein ACKVRN_00045 [Pyrinomonadaceae bacterium]